RRAPLHAGPALLPVDDGEGPAGTPAQPRTPARTGAARAAAHPVLLARPDPVRGDGRPPPGRSAGRRRYRPGRGGRLMHVPGQAWAAGHGAHVALRGWTRPAAAPLPSAR